MALLDDAARAHQRAQAGLEAAKKRAEELVTKARETVEETREALHDAMVAEALAGTSPVEIQRRAGYQSRETVRTILRRGGVEAE